MHCAIGVLRETLIVRDHANRGAALVQFSEQVHHCFAVARIKVPRRLVREQNRRPASKSARDCHSLLLAARELAWQMFCTMPHADALKGFGHKGFALTARHSSIGERQFDVLKNGEVADQIKTLENKTDLAIANACAVGKRKIGNFVSL